MNTIKFSVKKFNSNDPAFFLGDISYKAALLIQPNNRYFIGNKIYTVNEVEFTVANSKTGDNTKLTIYVSPK